MFLFGDVRFMFDRLPPLHLGRSQSSSDVSRLRDDLGCLREKNKTSLVTSSAEISLRFQGLVERARFTRDHHVVGGVRSDRVVSPALLLSLPIPSPLRS